MTKNKDDKPFVVHGGGGVTLTVTKSSSSVWVKDTDLIDKKPYLIAHNGVVYSVVYNDNIKHFVGFGYNERVKPDYVLEYPEVPTVV